jgi:hypothetical protein
MSEFSSTVVISPFLTGERRAEAVAVVGPDGLAGVVPADRQVRRRDADVVVYYSGTMPGPAAG